MLVHNTAPSERQVGDRCVGAAVRLAKGLCAKRHYFVFGLLSLCGKDLPKLNLKRRWPKKNKNNTKRSGGFHFHAGFLILSLSKKGLKAHGGGHKLGLVEWDPSLSVV